MSDTLSLAQQLDQVLKVAEQWHYDITSLEVNGVKLGISKRKPHDPRTDWPNWSEDDLAKRALDEFERMAG